MYVRMYRLGYNRRNMSSTDTVTFPCFKIFSLTRAITKVDLYIPRGIRNIYFIYTILARSVEDVCQVTHRKRAFLSSDAAQIQQDINTEHSILTL